MVVPSDQIAPGRRVVSVKGDVLVRVASVVGQGVGVDLVVVPVDDPHGRAVRPDAPGRGVVSPEGDVLVRVAGVVGQGVGVDLPLRRHQLGNPDGRVVRPDARGAAVVALQGDVLVRVAGAVGQGVGVELAVIRVGYPHGDAVGPGARGAGVAGRTQRVQVVTGLPPALDCRAPADVHRVGALHLGNGGVDHDRKRIEPHGEVHRVRAAAGDLWFRQ